MEALDPCRWGVACGGDRMTSTKASVRHLGEPSRGGALPRARLRHLLEHLAARSAESREQSAGAVRAGTGRSAGRGGGGWPSRTAGLLRQLGRWRVRPRWYGVALGVPVAISAAALGAAVIAGAQVPRWEPSDVLQVAGTLLVTMVLVGLFEELGWRGFLLPRLQRDRDALGAALLVGLAWLPWHLPELVSDPGQRPLAQFGVYIFALSVLLAWLYNSTQASLPVVILLHAAFNSFAKFFLSDLQGNPKLVAWWTLAGLTALVALAVVRSQAPGRSREEVPTPWARARRANLREAVHAHVRPQLPRVACPLDVGCRRACRPSAIGSGASTRTAQIQVRCRSPARGPRLARSRPSSVELNRALGKCFSTLLRLIGGCQWLMTPVSMSSRSFLVAGFVRASTWRAGGLCGRQDRSWLVVPASSYSWERRAARGCLSEGRRRSDAPSLESQHPGTSQDQAIAAAWARVFPPRK